MLTDEQRRFLEAQRVARLATADGAGQPHVIPICYALDGESIYFSVDRKPKRHTGKPLKRVRNILENPNVALVVDRYHEDWAGLGWLMITGHADVLEDGQEHDLAQTRMRQRYPQLRAMSIEALPVIAIRIAHAVGWGNLEVD
jgi:PPOX class probable F420-dependent enzyme